MTRRTFFALTVVSLLLVPFAAAQTKATPSKNAADIAAAPTCPILSL